MKFYTESPQRPRRHVPALHQGLQRLVSAVPLLTLLAFPACGGDDDDAATGGASGLGGSGASTGSGGTGGSTDTSGTGASSAEGPEGWVGKTFLLAVPERNWSEPDQIGAQIAEYVPEFLIKVNSVEGETAKVTLGTAKDGQQTLCRPTVDADATVSYPSIAIGPVDLPVFLENPVTAEDPADDVTVKATVTGLTLKDVLPQGSTAAATSELTATMDFREVYPMFTQLGDTRTADSTCDALNTELQVPCATCPSGGDYCLTLKAVRIAAQESAMGLEPVAAESTDPTCTPTQ